MMARFEPSVPSERARRDAGIRGGQRAGNMTSEQLRAAYTRTGDASYLAAARRLEGSEATDTFQDRQFTADRLARLRSDQPPMRRKAASGRACRNCGRESCTTEH